MSVVKFNFPFNPTELVNAESIFLKNREYYRELVINKSQICVDVANASLRSKNMYDDIEKLPDTYFMISLMKAVVSTVIKSRSLQEQLYTFVKDKIGDDSVSVATKNYLKVILEHLTPWSKDDCKEPFEWIEKRVYDRVPDECPLVYSYNIGNDAKKWADYADEDINTQLSKAVKGLKMCHFGYAYETDESGDRFEVEDKDVYNEAFKHFKLLLKIAFHVFTDNKTFLNYSVKHNSNGTTMKFDKYQIKGIKHLNNGKEQCLFAIPQVLFGDDTSGSWIFKNMVQKAFSLVRIDNTEDIPVIQSVRVIVPRVSKEKKEFNELEHEKEMKNKETESEVKNTESDMIYCVNELSKMVLASDMVITTEGVKVDKDVNKIFEDVRELLFIDDDKEHTWKFKDNYHSKQFKMYDAIANEFIDRFIDSLDDGKSITQSVFRATKAIRDDLVRADMTTLDRLNKANDDGILLYSKYILTKYIMPEKQVQRATNELFESFARALLELVVDNEYTIIEAFEILCCRSSFDKYLKESPVSEDKKQFTRACKMCNKVKFYNFYNIYGERVAESLNPQRIKPTVNNDNTTREVQDHKKHLPVNSRHAYKTDNAKAVHNVVAFSSVIGDEF